MKLFIAPGWAAVVGALLAVAGGIWGVVADRIATRWPEHDEEERWNEPLIGPEWAGPIAPTYFNTRKVSIYGGSNEIQRGIIAKAILGL